MIYGMMDGYCGDEAEFDAKYREIEDEQEQYGEQVLLHERYREDI